MGGDSPSRCCGGQTVANTDLKDENCPQPPSPQPEPGGMSKPSWIGPKDGAKSSYKITIDTSGGQRLGMDVDHWEEEMLLVAAVTPGGLVDQWNQANPDNAVKAEDRVMAANNVRGNVMQLVEECKKKQKLEITFMRASLNERIN